MDKDPQEAKTRADSGSPMIFDVSPSPKRLSRRGSSEDMLGKREIPEKSSSQKKKIEYRKKLR